MSNTASRAYGDKDRGPLWVVRAFYEELAPPAPRMTQASKSSRGMAATVGRYEAFKTGFAFKVKEAMNAPITRASHVSLGTPWRMPDFPYADPWPLAVYLQFHVDCWPDNMRGLLGSGDIDNRIKTVLDALNGVLWKDDYQIWSVHASYLPVWDGAQATGLEVTPYPWSAEGREQWQHWLGMRKEAEAKKAGLLGFDPA